MTDKLNYWAEYLMPGILFPEETVKQLDSHDALEALSKAPEDSFCFTLFDTLEPPDLGPDFRVLPTRKNQSKRYYIGGSLHTIEEAEKMGADGVAANMRGNNWAVVIKCRTGNWQPFLDGDVQLSDPA